jgi:hypothetical protein
MIGEGFVSFLNRSFAELAWVWILSMGSLVGKILADLEVPGRRCHWAGNWRRTDEMA